MKTTAKVLVVETENTNHGLLSDNSQMGAFASSIDYGIIVADTSGNIVDFNDAALEIFGYEEDELRGKSITTILPSRFHKAHNESMQASQDNLGKTLRLYGLTKQNREIPIEIALSSWRDTDTTQYFTASIRRYSTLENNLGFLLMSAAAMTAIMLITLIVIAFNTF